MSRKHLRTRSSAARGTVAVALLCLAMFGPSAVATDDSAEGPCPLPPFQTWSPGKAGLLGVPVLAGVGPMTPGSTNVLALSKVIPFTQVHLVFGYTPLRAPFKGGILGPTPDCVYTFFADPSGGLVIPFIWPASAPPCFSLWMQYWANDPSVSHQFSATNTLQITGQ